VDGVTPGEVFMAVLELTMAKSSSTTAPKWSRYRSVDQPFLVSANLRISGRNWCESAQVLSRKGPARWPRLSRGWYCYIP